MTKRSVILSAALHSLLLLAMIAGGTGNGKGKGDKEGEGQEQRGKDGAFLDKSSDGDRAEPKDLSVTLIYIPTKKQELKSPGVKDCKGDDWYGGIGITTNYPDRIREIAKGYAADRAGLKVGDQILIPADTYAFRGTPGTAVEVTLVRDGQTITLTIVREKICVDAIK